MKKTLSLIAALCLLSGLCAFAAPAKPLPLDEGVYWGMSAADFAAAYDVVYNQLNSDHDYSENARVTVFFTDEVSFLGSDAFAAGFFIDDRLVCVGWDNITESYDDICAYFADACGSAAENGSEHFDALIDTLGFSLDVYTSPGFSGWQLCDGTYLAVFHYSETDCGVMYVNEALMQMLLSQDAAATDAAATEAAADGIPFFGAIPWGIRPASVISEMAIEDYDVVYQENSSDCIITLIYSDYTAKGYVCVNDQLVCVVLDCNSSDLPYTYDVLLAEACRFGEPTHDCGERILAIMNMLVPGRYSSAEDFYDTCGWELSDGSFMSLCRYDDGESFALMITNESLLFSLAAE